LSSILNETEMQDNIIWNQFRAFLSDSMFGAKKVDFVIKSSFHNVKYHLSLVADFLYSQTIFTV
jgi:hypothetical protein